MNLIRLIFLFPLSIIYGQITDFRNWLFDQGILSETKFDIPIISVGNLAVGGTGKTPFVEFLIETYLIRGKKIAIVSRGYKRKSNGVTIASDESTPSTIGDEATMIYQKFKGKVVMIVSKNRVTGVSEVLKIHPETDLIILDDAFQHRYLTRDLNILLTTYQNPFYNNDVMPLGNLREKRVCASRADLILITKCSAEADSPKQMEIRQKTASYSDAPVFFSTIEYMQCQNCEGSELPQNSPVLLVTGIANSTPLKDFIKVGYNLKEHLNFGDHHNYQQRDVRKILNTMKIIEAKFIITTEKDWVKLRLFDQLRPFLYQQKIRCTIKNSDNLMGVLDEKIDGKLTFKHVQ
ncbi:MAG: tetraacyldisaccharide 4'-kinase [Cyclobacteriaceae bacterium]